MRDWVSRAACSGRADPEAFFPDDRKADVQRDAGWYCQRCPVTVECLEYALEHREVGVWGNTTTRERTNMRRRARERGRVA